MDYLKDEQYYTDLYDLLTINDCLRSYESAIKVPPQPLKELKVGVISLTIDIFTYYIMGKRFRNKLETINDWMRREKEKENKVENATTPENIYCDFCSSKMDMIMKHLYGNDDRIMFWFDCPACKKRKAIFDNGEEYKVKPNYCPKCSSELKETFERVGEILTTNITCPDCKYKTKEIEDFEKNRKEWEEKQRQDRELLRKYRFKFCMTDKEGQEYISHVENMKQLATLMKETEEKQKDPAYKQVLNIKKLKVNDLRKKLDIVLSKEKFINLQFDKPQIDRFVIIPFSVEDADDKREEYKSITICKRLINNSLEETNWKLMADGIDYRLGYLSGRLKGYEGEEDLMEMVRKKSEINL